MRKLYSYGVQPEVIAAAFGLALKTVERALRKQLRTAKEAGQKQAQDRADLRDRFPAQYAAVEAEQARMAIEREARLADIARGVRGGGGW